MDDHFSCRTHPGIRYQAFIVGIQAVSRNGLASQEELSAFNRQVDAFAQSMGGQTLHTDLAAFIEVASALDAFCARRPDHRHPFGFPDQHQRRRTAFRRNGRGFRFGRRRRVPLYRHVGLDHVLHLLAQQRAVYQCPFGQPVLQRLQYAARHPALSGRRKNASTICLWIWRYACPAS